MYFVKSGFQGTEIFIGIHLTFTPETFVELSGKKDKTRIGCRNSIGVVFGAIHRNQ